MSDDYFDIEFVCLNEEDGFECEYPFCDCEQIIMGEYLELPDLFAIIEDEGVIYGFEDEDE